MNHCDEEEEEEEKCEPGFRHGNRTLRPFNSSGLVLFRREI